MDEIIDAIVSGDYEKAVELGKSRLISDPEDGSTHCILAIAYEKMARYEDALNHITACLGSGRDVFDHLIIAFQCAKELGHHKQAYEFAERALNTNLTPVMPKFFSRLFSALAIIPRLKGIKEFEIQRQEEYQEQLEQLREYVDRHKQ
ncbi:MAG: hypothetical protein ABW088_14175 [Sedimenticola sp.]